MTLPKISPQQRKLTQLLFSFRYINRLQFQHYLGHSKSREINRLLKDLVDKGYIRRAGKQTDLSKPLTYCIGRKGVNYIAQLKGVDRLTLKNRYKDYTRSQAFIDHQLLLTDIYLQLKKSDEENTVKLTFQTKIDFEEGSSLSRFHPDAFVLEEGEDSKKISLIELIDIEAQRFVLKRRIRSLIKLYLSNSLEVETGEDFPTILFICPTMELLGFLRNYIKKIEDAEEITFKFTTAEKVKNLGFNGRIWKGIKEPRESS